MMRIALPALLILLFLIESTWFQIFFPPSLERDGVLVPRFALLVVVMMSIFRGPVSGVLAGVSMGILYDFVFTDVLGIYTFSMGVVAYTCAITYAPVRRNLTLVLLILITSVALLEVLVYGLHYVIGFTSWMWEDFAFKRLIPTLILNGSIAILLMFPVKKLILKVEEYEELWQR